MCTVNHFTRGNHMKKLLLLILLVSACGDNDTEAWRRERYSANQGVRACQMIVDSYIALAERCERPDLDPEALRRKLDAAYSCQSYCTSDVPAGFEEECLPFVREEQSCTPTMPVLLPVSCNGFTRTTLCDARRLP